MSGSSKTEEFQKIESGGFFKFEVKGDNIVGTMSESKFQKSTVQGFKDQMIYTLVNTVVNGEDEGPGSERKIGISKDYVNSKLKKVAIGQRVKIAFEDEYQTEENKKKGMKPSKNLEVYAGQMDETFVPNATVRTDEPIDIKDIPF